MNVTWVLADAAMIDPMQDLAALKTIGSFWGGWRTWRAYATDNVVCHDMKQANVLLKRNFQTQCNFYIPNAIYPLLDRPAGVRLYEGEFVHDVDRQEEIVALHLVATASDIVLMVGFDLADYPKNPDKLIENRTQHYRNLVKHVVATNKRTQWVLVDHEGEIGKLYAGLDNLTKDSLNNVIELLTN